MYGKEDLSNATLADMEKVECPVCRRTLPQIARKGKSGKVQVVCHKHHDHIEDHVFSEYSRMLSEIKENDPFYDGPYISHEARIYKIIEFVRKFKPVDVCMDCNTADATAKLKLGLPAPFSFSPHEIRHIISVESNKKHVIDFDVAQGIYEEKKTVFESALYFITCSVAKVFEPDYWDPSDDQVRFHASLGRSISGARVRKYGELTGVWTPLTTEQQRAKRAAE